MVVILVIGGVQMMMLGILGEYLWRTYDESRRSPRYIIEYKLDSINERNKYLPPQAEAALSDNKD